MKKLCLMSGAVGLAFVLSSNAAQSPYALQRQRKPMPPPNHVAVRFGIGDEEVKCSEFRLRAKAGNRVIIDGRFASTFPIPKEALELQRENKLVLEFSCNKHNWRFQNVPEIALRWSFWMVGTDYPPYGPEFKGDVAVWIQYLIVDSPDFDPGFEVTIKCPADADKKACEAAAKAGAWPQNVD